MNAKPLVVITTRLPPAICGIGTYSWQVREHWPDRARPWHFLVVDHSPASGLTERGDRVTTFAGEAPRLARALEDIGAADVLVHYAGRAYHRYGFPFWLPRVLADWKRRHPSARVTAFVHELPGPIPMTSRHFWLGALSKMVARRLLRMADVIVTNTESHRSTLRRMTTHEVHLLPISSSMEPPADAASIARERTEFVLFGLPFGRTQTRRMFAAHLARWRAAGRLTVLHTIGPATDEPEGDVIPLGVLPVEEISRRLSKAEFCLTNATVATWSKSTTFMAAAAHGCLPVIIGPRPEAAPLVYAVAADEVEHIGAVELSRRRRELLQWYASEAAIAVTVQRLAALVSPERRDA